MLGGELDMKIKDLNLEELLIRAGYKQHFVISGSFIKESYIRDRNTSRFHLFFNKNNDGLPCRTSGKLHLDVYIKGKHKSIKEKQIILEEMNYIRSFKERIPPTPPKTIKEKSTIPRNGIIAPNMRELIKTKVIKRNWYNPMRYIKGKFIYKKWVDINN